MIRSNSGFLFLTCNFLGLFSLLWSSCSTFVGTREKTSLIPESVVAGKIYFSRDLLNDMYLPHEDVPAGVPDIYEWKKGPASSYGIDIPKGWNAVVSWGQVYAVDSEPNPDIDFPLVSVHIKDLKLFIYRKNRTWKLFLDDQNPIGEMYTEDFEDYPDKPYIQEAALVKEEGGGISVKAGSGYNFHFYSDRKAIVNRNNIAGVFVVCKARLVGTENYDIVPKYLLNVGGDWYRSIRSSHNMDLSNNGDIAIGRFKYVTPEWQYFIMHTFSEEELENIIFPIE